ncbi:GLUG motif-containing protein [Enterococcus casseliflavus]|uniref:GLUG motif-containing protein n=1 Tax=Enterococcus casseliflavus TaxID=37734 RepID=UPI0018834907|nr:GLUG motif-containing protein [Enterococcus casseliflavus]MBE9909326.1 hypothetical protein [Enterococcus casseliflavus]
MPDFNGVLNGNGYSISGLTHSLFDYVENTEIKNVVLSGTSILDTTNEYTGGLIGLSQKDNSIFNSSTNVEISGNTVGGLVGMTYNTTIISDCYSTGWVNNTAIGNSRSGGLVGWVSNVTK